MYQTRIRERLAKIGRIGTNPRWVEAWMRLEHGCLDGLTVGQFNKEVEIACECIDASTQRENESLAASI